MKKILSVENMRASDAATIATKVPGKELMRRAGEAMCEVIEKEHGFGKNAAIICGTGNNAGDGYVMALLMKVIGVDVQVLIVKEKFTPDSRFYYEQCERVGIPMWVLGDGDASKLDFRGCDMIIDCLLGTGFRGDAREPISTLIRLINQAKESGVYVVSADINSGLNGDSGTSALCVYSNLTISVGDFKPGHFLGIAKDVMDKKVNCPIGITPVKEPYYLFEGSDAAICLPERKNDSNKGTYGYIALVGGCIKYGGAIQLADAANCAMRSGAGVVSVAVPGTIINTVATRILESTLFELDDDEGYVVYKEDQIEELMKHKRVIAFGMGIGKSDESKKILEKLLLEYEGILIIDADGLNCLAEMNRKILDQTKAKVVLTPHLGEMARLTGEDINNIKTNSVNAAVEYAKDRKAIVLLKGASTIVTDGECVYIVDRGCSGMATAGSGDVLSGILAAICGFNEKHVLEAVAAGAWINGRAGEMAQEEYGDVSMIASDTVKYIPQVLKEIRK